MSFRRARFTIPERREPVYLGLLRSGELERRVRLALGELASCTVCPRDCRVDRLGAVPPDGRTGVRVEAGPIAGDAPKWTVSTHIAKGTSCSTDRYARVSSALMTRSEAWSSSTA